MVKAKNPTSPSKARRGLKLTSKESKLKLLASCGVPCLTLNYPHNLDIYIYEWLTYTYKYMCTYICRYMYKYACMYVCMDVYIYIYIYIYIYVYMCMHTIIIFYTPARRPQKRGPWLGGLPAEPQARLQSLGYELHLSGLRRPVSGPEG